MLLDLAGSSYATAVPTCAIPVIAGRDRGPELQSYRWSLHRLQACACFQDIPQPSAKRPDRRDPVLDGPEDIEVPSSVRQVDFHLMDWRWFWDFWNFGYKALTTSEDSSPGTQIHGEKAFDSRKIEA